MNLRFRQQMQFQLVLLKNNQRYVHVSLFYVRNFHKKKNKSNVYFVVVFVLFYQNKKPMVALKERLKLTMNRYNYTHTQIFNV